MCRSTSSSSETSGSRSSRVTRSPVSASSWRTVRHHAAQGGRVCGRRCDESAQRAPAGGQYPDAASRCLGREVDRRRRGRRGVARQRRRTAGSKDGRDRLRRRRPGSGARSCRRRRTSRCWRIVARSVAWRPRGRSACRSCRSPSCRFPRRGRGRAAGGRLWSLCPRDAARAPQRRRPASGSSIASLRTPWSSTWSMATPRRRWSLLPGGAVSRRSTGAKSSSIRRFRSSAR